MAAVLTTSMTLRIILAVRGSLAQGGAFALSAHSNSGTGTGSSRTTNVLSSSRSAPTTNNHTFTLDHMRSKPEEWTDPDAKQTADIVVGPDDKVGVMSGSDDELAHSRDALPGVKVTVDREVDYAPFPHRK